MVSRELFEAWRRQRTSRHGGRSRRPTTRHCRSSFCKQAVIWWSSNARRLGGGRGGRGGDAYHVPRGGCVSWSRRRCVSAMVAARLP
jgi:hypothetical protein